MHAGLSAASGPLFSELSFFFFFRGLHLDFYWAIVFVMLCNAGGCTTTGELVATNSVRIKHSIAGGADDLGVLYTMELVQY